MCAILALLLADTTSHCRQAIFDGLTVLQHRGQDAAGIVTSRTTEDSTQLNQHKGLGMVRDVFTQGEMLKLEGNCGIGHCRYPTAGRTSSPEEAQPMYNNYPCGLALAHNGNLTNKNQLQDHVRGLHRHLNTQSDSEALLNVFAEELRLQLDSRGGQRTAKIEPEHIFAAVKRTMELCRGGYAVVMLIHDVGVLAFRDPWGIRPIMVGSRKSQTLEGGIDYVFSSESVASDTLGFDMLRDVRPGECMLAVPMKPNQPREDLGLISKQLVGDGNTVVPCLFEYVYFARPDSIMNGVSVYESRLQMGEKLADKIMREHPNEKIDVVIPIPDTSRTSALALAHRMGIPYREGFIKNRYIGRTFIMPEQSQRKKNVRLKLNTVRAEFEGLNVLLVDDSIVRGTTSTQLVSMARDAGANKVFFCSAAPEIRHPNIYGIDLPTASELVAFDRTSDEIAEVLKCDWVLFQDLDDLEEAVRAINPELKTFEGSTFSGSYVTNDVDVNYFSSLAEERNDFAKLTREQSVQSVRSTPSQV
ncbi:Amidophosphoribosyltransferase [Hondaea fermentalgiana]|uniref:Amidophosphoribosyltransferase n=1 Tax=Hondaea fermentalgiana TaxID=2315210 RepID=A0A2R5GSC8_9STRA|nr:Amidophosphoribosyltransferase [Hondaea fermentalgiana]|eukprot:GBG33786.1 Amidophosphoribosyltransferase [Hondaea fermentalgiana]